MPFYGFGWRLNGQAQWHSGESIGFRNVILRYPGHRLSVIILSNRDGPEPYPLALQIAQRWLNTLPMSTHAPSLLLGIHHVAVIGADYARSRPSPGPQGLRVLDENYRAARDSWKLDLALPDGGQLELFSFPALAATAPPAARRRRTCATWRSGWLHPGPMIERLAWPKASPCEPIRTGKYTGRALHLLRRSGWAAAGALRNHLTCARSRPVQAHCPYPARMEVYPVRPVPAPAPAFTVHPWEGTCARPSRPCCWRCRCYGRDVRAGRRQCGGRWKTIDDETGKVKSIVEITQAANGTLTGKVVEILHSDKGPNPICDGCEGANKSKPVKGVTILWNLKAGRRPPARVRRHHPGPGQRQPGPTSRRSSDRSRRRQAGGLDHRLHLRGQQTWVRE